MVRKENKPKKNKQQKTRTNKRERKKVEISNEAVKDR